MKDIVCSLLEILVTHFVSGVTVLHPDRNENFFCIMCNRPLCIFFYDKIFKGMSNMILSAQIIF